MNTINKGYQNFLDAFPFDTQLVTVDENLLLQLKKILPQEMIEFWNEQGFGPMGNGILKAIDPRDYMQVFYEWLGGVDYSRIPLFVTAFGDIIYYRNINSTTYDISILDIHYRKTQVLAESFEEFFNETVVGIPFKDFTLKASLFKEAEVKCGGLSENEIYFFVPALILGGAESIEYIDKGDGGTHHRVLLHLGSK